MSANKGKFDFLKASRPAPVEHSRTQHAESPEISQPEKPRGRPKGKRTDADYTQVTAYIRKETHQAVKIRLLQEGQGREFSEVIQELLDSWLHRTG
jgi:hypothetical protein